MHHSRRGRVKHMISSKGSRSLVLKTGRDIPLKRFQRTPNTIVDRRGNARGSYRNVLQGGCSPALTGELCKPKVFRVYGPTLGGEPRYQLVHSREWKQAKREQRFRFRMMMVFFERRSLHLDHADTTARAVRRNDDPMSKSESFLSR